MIKNNMSVFHDGFHFHGITEPPRLSCAALRASGKLSGLEKRKYKYQQTNIIRYVDEKWQNLAHLLPILTDLRFNSVQPATSNFSLANSAEHLADI